MKRSTFIALIVGLAAFVGAIAATLYYLKKRGILSSGDECGCVFPDDTDCCCEDVDCCDDFPDDDLLEPAAKTAEEPQSEAGQPDGADTDAKNRFGF